jgi:hypothetical protein
MNISDQIRRILAPVELDARLIVARADGILLYDSSPDHKSSSMAALVSGLWQASEALMGLHADGSDLAEFRLGFDTASQGVYLLPFDHRGQRFFLGGVYRECLNPGRLKRDLGQLRARLEATLPATTPELPRRDGYLFQEISDEEMNRLFAVAGV